MRLSSIPASVPRPLRKKLALPMAQTSLASLQRGRNCRKRIVSSVFLRKYGVMRMHQLTTLDMAVAALAPATPQPNTMTNTRFKTTLMTPAAMRKSIGFFVSPAADRTPLPKLYSASAGNPMLYILK